MFENNWYLFLLIVMIVFISDGDFSRRETAVMIGILAALAFTNSTESDLSAAATTSNNCFCNKTIT